MLNLILNLKINQFIFLSPFQSLGGNELKSVNNVHYNLTSSMLYTIMYKQ